MQPALISGVLFAVAWALLIDGACIAHREPKESNHFHFVLVIPAIFSMLAFMMMNCTSPSEMFPDPQPKAKAFFLLSWVLFLSSTLASLTIVGVSFVGTIDRQSVWPGVSLVVHSAVLPLASVALWFAKHEKGDSLVYDDEE